MMRPAQVCDIEKRAFLFFKKDISEDYKRFLIYMVHKTIEINDSPTISKLAFMLHHTYRIDLDDVNSSITALESPDIFNSVSKWTTAKQRSTHLHIKKSNVYKEWEATIVKQRPELLTLTLPSIKRNTMMTRTN